MSVLSLMPDTSPKSVKLNSTPTSPKPLKWAKRLLFHALWFEKSTLYGYIMHFRNNIELKC